MSRTATLRMLTVENRQRDSKHLHRVWNTEDGKRPAEGDEPESYKLDLGSQDDVPAPGESADPADPALSPSKDVPKWAIDVYRKVKTFAHWERTSAITVRSAA